MSTAAYEVQRAVYEALSTDQELATLVTGVYDHVPENARFPYVKIGGGDTETNQPSTMGTPGRENVIAVHVWSRYPGQAEVKTISRVVTERLDGYALNLLPWKWTGTLYISSEYLDDPDGITRHGALRFRVRSQKGS
jgi:hypothetical protein